MGEELVVEPLEDLAAADSLVSAIPEFRGRVVDVATDAFPAYARIFHRPDQGLPDDDTPRTWAAIAADRGTVFHPAAQFADLSWEANQQDTAGSLGHFSGLSIDSPFRC